MRPAPRLVAASLWATSLALACGCPDTVSGVHDGDRIRTTVVGPYRGSSEYVLGAYSGTMPCVGVADLAPGSALTMKARFISPANACPISRLDLALESSNVPAYSPSTTNDWSFPYSAGGCTGTVSLDFVTLGGDPSLYDDDGTADGGSPLWVLGRQFTPSGGVPAGPDAGGPDGGVCPLACADAFIARNEHL
ncbi:MAG: hypothetical protein ACRENE_27395 [Polyangiaceae bacterium]